MEIKRGVILTYLTLIIGNLISFIYTPFMIRCLGQSEYGLISFTNSIISYISLIDSGFGTAVVRYNAECIAADNREKQAKLNGTFLKLYSFLGALSIVIGIVIAVNMETIFTKYTPAEIQIAGRLLLISSLNLAISFPLNIFSSIIIANEKFSFNKGLNLVKTIVSPVLSVAILFSGGKSIALVSVNLIVTVIVGIINVFYCFYKLHVYFSNQLVEIDIFGEIVKYSFYIFLSMIAYQVYWNTDQFVIGKTLGAIPIAIYAVGMNFNHYFRTFSDFASNIFLPRFTKKVRSGVDVNTLMNDLISVSRMQLFICMLIYSGFIILGKQFILRWVGSEYEDSFNVAVIVMSPQIVSIIQSLFATLLQAMNKHKVKAYIYLGMALVNLVLTVIFVKPFGIIGCAYATAIGMALNAVANNLYYSLVLGIDIKKYWKSILTPFIVSGVLMALGYFSINSIKIESYTDILVAAFIYSIVYFCAMWALAFNNEEKRLVHSFISAVIGKINILHCFL